MKLTTTFNQGDLVRINGCACYVTKTNSNFMEITPVNANHKITSTPGEPFNIVILKNASPNNQINILATGN